MNDTKYSNAVEIQVQLFDAQLKFNLQNQNGVIDSTTIILSPQHLKVLGQMLSSAILEYEKQFGEISLPQSETQIEKQKLVGE